VRILELADRLRARGLTVVEVAGWHTRGHDFPVRPDGAIRHWTAGALFGDAPSLRVCTHGRQDLVGPLCNVFQSRAVDSRGLDVVHVVAAGKANHAGTGSWNGASGNYAFLGLEIEWAGPTEPFAPVRNRKFTSELVMRALLDCAAGNNTDDVCEHREYAPTRKIDTNLSGAELRRRMVELNEGDDLLAALTDDQQRRLLENTEAIRQWVVHFQAQFNDVDQDADNVSNEMLGHGVDLWRQNLNNAARTMSLEWKLDALLRHLAVDVPEMPEVTEPEGQ